MKPTRVSHLTQIGALLLLTTTVALGAGTVQPPSSPARSARLFEIGVHRYFPEPGGRILQQDYLLSAKGELRPTSASYVPSGVVIPPEAFEHVLLPGGAVLAYLRLGDDALENFDIDLLPVLIAERTQFKVTARADAKLDVGAVTNLSARSQVEPERPLTGGFVVTGEPRTVLIRAVGPSLVRVGVVVPLPNPVLTLFRESAPIDGNDDWGNRPDRTRILETASRVGAFPLDAGSRDAVLLAQLPPGAYTAQVTSADANSGEVLLEIYIVP